MSEISLELARKIAEMPEGKDLISYLAGKALELNTLADVKIDNMEQAVPLAIEVKARKKAFDKLTEILEPFINIQGGESKGFKNSEYNV